MFSLNGFPNKKVHRAVSGCLLPLCRAERKGSQKAKSVRWDLRGAGPFFYCLQNDFQFFPESGNESSELVVEYKQLIQQVTLRSSDMKVGSDMGMGKEGDQHSQPSYHSGISPTGGSEKWCEHSPVKSLQKGKRAGRVTLQFYQSLAKGSSWRCESPALLACLERQLRGS